MNGLTAQWRRPTFLTKKLGMAGVVTEPSDSKRKVC